METETLLEINFELPLSTGKLVEHDFSVFSPEEAFAFFEEQVLLFLANDWEHELMHPDIEPFVMH